MAEDASNYPDTQRLIGFLCFRGNPDTKSTGRTSREINQTTSMPVLAGIRPISWDTVIVSIVPVLADMSNSLLCNHDN